MKKYLAEFIGTFTLVLFGCGTAVVSGGAVGHLGIAFAFGFALLAMCYGIGPVSGCHVNPAVSLGVFTAGRMTVGDLVGYVIAQFLGALAGAGVLAVIAKGLLGGYNVASSGLGQNGWGEGYQAGYALSAGMVFEFVATLLFVIVILGSTQGGAPTQMAGLAIGITLVVIHIFGINITGVSVNPARSLGPAILVGGKAISQVWMFLIVPSIAGVLAGTIFRSKILEV
jgi:aquaporin Z